jgi:hypothetical protein
MFAKSDGPTSLRSDLVWALSFSMEPIELETSAGPRACQAALAAIWTGAKGECVVVIRQLDPPAVARYRFTEEITSVEDVDYAVDAALGFVTSMGFMLDASEFRSLPSEMKGDRLDRWDAIRKVRKEKRPGSRRQAKAEVEDEDTPKPAPPPAPEAASGNVTDSGKAVLARIPLVRREGSSRGLDSLGRLLSFF